MSGIRCNDGLGLADLAWIDGIWLSSSILGHFCDRLNEHVFRCEGSLIVLVGLGVALSHSSLINFIIIYSSSCLAFSFRITF